ncbi:hypothetical protein FB45DRAFT_1028485 [Roridomyces roridus]|uniref:Uncharacterized protein n=1 Tax=Roridomyces roridus TaxID=1738132 RepID=A0AAD7BR29_9AGAR|nr:hypothetical protein FB45DRAFT_1028485 [Roridomyces roridus]
MEEALLVETIQSEIDACEKGVEQYKAAPAGPRKSQAILKSFLDRVEWSKTFLELILFMLLEARPLPAPINAKTVQSSFTSTLTVIREVYEPKPIRPIRHLVDSAEPAAEPKDALANETDTQTFFSARWQQFLSAIKTTVQGPYLEIVCQHVKQVPAALQLSGAASSVPAFHDIQKILSDFFADGSRKVFGLKAVVACINEYSALKNLEIRIEFRIELAQLLLDCLRPWGTDEHEIVGETAKAIEKLLTSLKALRTSLTYGGNGEQEFEKISAEFESAWDLEIRTKIFTKMIITKYTDKTTDEELHASRSELPQDSGGLKISSSAASILHLVKGSKIFKKITGK